MIGTSLTCTACRRATTVSTPRLKCQLQPRSTHTACCGHPPRPLPHPHLLESAVPVQVVWSFNGKAVRTFTMASDIPSIPMRSRTPLQTHCIYRLSFHGLMQHPSQPCAQGCGCIHALDMATKCLIVDRSTRSSPPSRMSHGTLSTRTEVHTGCLGVVSY